MDAIWNHLLANCAIILFAILAWTNLPEPSRPNEFVERAKLGVFFGVATLVLMTRPLELNSGIHIDLRTIPVSIAGLFGGWPGALVAATIAGAFRWWLGGAGTTPGLAVIALSAAIGAVCAGRLAKPTSGFIELALFSGLVALGDLAVVLIMPQDTARNLLQQSAPLLLATIFVTTFLASMAMHAEQRRRDASRTLRIYEAVIQSLPESLNVKDRQGRFILANPATAKLMRARSEQDLIGKSDIDFYPADLAETFRADECHIIHGYHTMTIEQEIAWPGCSPITLSTLKAPLLDENGVLIGLITHNRDLTEKKKLIRALADSERRAQAALSNMADGLIMFDADLNVIFCNEQYRSMFPLTADVRVPGVPARTILETAMARGELTGIAPEAATAFIDGAMARLREAGTVEFPLYDGRWIESRTTPSDDGGCLVVCSDITRAKRDEQNLRDLNEKLVEMAMTDSLTGLLNRRAFDTSLVTEMSRSQGSDAGLSILLMDVDRFKAYNDTYGHTAGDDCLKRVAQTVRSVARRPGDRAARYGGEEMAVVLPNTSAASAIAIARELLERIRNLDISHAGSEKGIVTASIGIATLGVESRHLLTSQFIGRADEALYRAKASGRDCVLAWEEERSRKTK